MSAHLKPVSLDRDFYQLHARIDTDDRKWLEEESERTGDRIAQLVRRSIREFRRKREGQSR